MDGLCRDPQPPAGRGHHQHAARAPGPRPLLGVPHSRPSLGLGRRLQDLQVRFEKLTFTS